MVVLKKKKKQEVGEDLSVCMLNLQVVYVLNPFPEVTDLLASYVICKFSGQEMHFHKMSVDHTWSRDQRSMWY